LPCNVNEQISENKGLCLNSIAGGFELWYTKAAPTFHCTLWLPYSRWMRWEDKTNCHCTQSCSGRCGVWSTVLSNEKGPLQLQVTADGLPSPPRKPNIYWYLGPHIRIHTVNGWIQHWQQQLRQRIIPNDVLIKCEFARFEISV